MRSSVFFTVLALAVSVSSMSLAHSPDHLAHRRHASDVNNSVLQARAARRRNMSDKYAEAELAAAKRDKVSRPRRRGTNARRCAVKSSSSALPLATSAPVVNVGADPTSSAAPKETSTSAAPTKTTPKSKAASKTSTSAQAAPTDDDSPSGSGETFTGEATFYGTGLGACGITNVDTDYICAVSQLLFDGFEGYAGGNPNANPICGKKIIATYQGKTVTVTVTDRCVACAKEDLDFAPSAFDKLADQALGRLKGMTWRWA